MSSATTSNRSLPPAKEVWGKVMFLHLCVILSTGGKGGLPNLPPHVGRPGGGWADPPNADPPGQTPRMQTPSPGLGRPHHPTWMQIPLPWGWADPLGFGRAPRVWQTPPPPDTVNKWAVRILLECILVLL